MSLPLLGMLLGALSATPSDSIPGTPWTHEDWQIFEATVRWADQAGLAGVPQGPAMARIATHFIGATYTPATLEVPGAERLVVNFRAFDCVTFVENVIALAWFVRHDGVALLADPPAARRRYEAHLIALRYRGGMVDGYPSRLHYFSEWLTDNAARGQLALVSDTFGTRLDDEPIRFMTDHPSAYRQLAEPGVTGAIGRIEARLNVARGRRMVPEAEIATSESQIRDGDVIAATSTLYGLDVAHTGIAVWHEGRVHLLHAPLVGKTVERSAVPLAERILAQKAQDGIMVGRVSDAPAAHR